MKENNQNNNENNNLMKVMYINNACHNACNICSFDWRWHATLPRVFGIAP